MIRWGIAGTGNIAQAFARVLLGEPDAQLVAVGSRDLQRAYDFVGAIDQLDGPTYEVPDPLNYEALMAHPNLDVVYIATPASHHYRHALLALDAGKHVLVEKPFTVNAGQAQVLLEYADARNVFIMEAAWCRFLPSWRQLRLLLDEQPIGEITMLQAAFGGRAEYHPGLRPFRLDLAGGALMDGGVYPIHLAHTILGVPSTVEAFGWPFGGVDRRNTMLLGWDAGRMATIASSTDTTLDASACIYGTEGMIEIPANFTNPTWINILYPGAEPVTYDFFPDRDRLAYQIDEVHRCITCGLSESPVMPVSESVEIMGTLDRVRESMGLRFTDEAEAI